MSKPIIFKGKIQFVDSKTSHKKTSIKYASPTFKEGFEDNITDTMMASFRSLNLTEVEKKQLSRSHRKMLNCYRHLNPFSLNADAKNLILEINQSKHTHIVIEANHYGAYVCLAAFFSGKLSKEKKIEFNLEKAPLALFPKSLMKTEPKNNLHKVVFRLSDDCWVSPFTTLYSNQKIKYSLKSKKAA